RFHSSADIQKIPPISAGCFMACSSSTSMPKCCAVGLISGQKTSSEEGPSNETWSCVCTRRDRIFWQARSVLTRVNQSIALSMTSCHGAVQLRRMNKAPSLISGIKTSPRTTAMGSVSAPCPTAMLGWKEDGRLCGGDHMKQRLRMCFGGPSPQEQTSTSIDY